MTHLDRAAGNMEMLIEGRLWRQQAVIAKGCQAGRIVDKSA
jgi:hypothetical protein